VWGYGQRQAWLAAPASEDDGPDGVGVVSINNTFLVTRWRASLFGSRTSESTVFFLHRTNESSGRQE
jgi:hypothetical protein